MDSGLVEAQRQRDHGGEPLAKAARHDDSVLDEMAVERGVQQSRTSGG